MTTFRPLRETLNNSIHGIFSGRKVKMSLSLCSQIQCPLSICSGVIEFGGTSMYRTETLINQRPLSAAVALRGPEFIATS